MAGSHQIVSIDSQERGERVHVANSGTSGETPLLDQIPRSRTIEIERVDRKGNVHRTTVACDIRTADSIVPNSLTALLGLASPAFFGVGLAGFITDFSTGNAYECGDIVLPKIQETQAGSEVCHRILVIPSTEMTPSDSSYFAKRWIKKSNAKQEGCSRFFYSGETLRQLHYFNRRLDRQLTADDFSIRQLRQVAFSSRATHIAFLNFDTRTDKLYLSAEILDIHKAKSSSDVDSAKLKYGATEDRDFTTSWKIDRYLPNSINFGIAINENPLGLQTRTPEYAVEEEKDNTTLPSLLSGFSVSSIKHPRGFHNWDLSLDLSGTLSGRYIDKTLTLRERTDENESQESFEYHTRYYYVLPGAAAGITIFTPFANIIMHGIAGPALTVGRDSEGNSSERITDFWGLRAEAYGFFSKDLYIRSGARFLHFRRAPFHTPYYDSGRMLYEIHIIGLGYYLDDKIPYF